MVPAAGAAGVQPYPIKFAVHDVTAVLSPGPDMDESYSLEVASAGCTVSAATVWGAFKALETIAQLVSPGKAAGGLQMPAVTIQDKPRFGWRGLMIDTVSLLALLAGSNRCAG
eukprot:SAG22_NODE_1315_length_4769_cov_23.910064_4_plen_113_part_00